MTTRYCLGLKQQAHPLPQKANCLATFWPGLLTSLLSVFLLFLLAGCNPAKPPFNAMDVTGAPWGQKFSLTDLNGKTVTQADFPGKITVVFFGFMYCPDACPTHLTKMGRVQSLLGPDADKLQLIFITVDPLRDQPEVLKKYLASFDPKIIGLRGTEEQVGALASEFRVFFKKVPTKASSNDPMAYTIDHTTFTYVYDTKGQLRLVVPHDLAEDQIANDFKNLINQ
jgi:protein SCO1